MQGLPQALRANASVARSPRAHRRAALSSRSGQGQPLVEDLVRRAIAQRLAGAAVQPALDLAHLLRRDLPEIGTLGEAFADQTIGSLVQAALPGMARGREAEPRLQPGGNLPASGELLAVVRGHGVRPVPVRTQAPQQGLGHRRCGVLGDVHPPRKMASPGMPAAPPVRLLPRRLRHRYSSPVSLRGTLDSSWRRAQALS